MPLNQNLKKLMSDASVSVQELSKKTGVKASAIYKIISGDIPNPGLFNILPIAEFFSISVNKLVGDESIERQPVSSPLSERYLVPIVEWDEIHKWGKNYSSKTRGKNIFTDFQPNPKTYALVVKTNNFLPIFPNDSILIIDYDGTPFHKSYVIVSSETGATTIKQALFDNDVIYLKPLTDSIPASMLQKSEQISGVVIEARIKFNNQS